MFFILFFVFFCALFPSIAPADCPSGTIAGQDSQTCYAFNIQPTDFWSADVVCKNEYNGNLASISSSFENAFVVGVLKNILPNSILSTTQIWLGGYKNGSAWTWLDGSGFSYTNWAKAQPSSGNCLYLNPSQATSDWYSSDCSSQYAYLCKFQATSKPTINPKNPCKVGYVYWHLWNYCYKYVNENLTWNAAQAYCANDGGNLASLHSYEEDGFVDNMCHNYGSGAYQTPWIGFSTSNPDYSLKQYWLWNDGTETTHSNWYPGSPVTQQDNDGGSCAYFVSSPNPWSNSSYWNNVYNCATLQPFVCKQFPLAN